MKKWVKTGKENNPETIIEQHGFYPKEELEEYADILNEVFDMVPLGQLEQKIHWTPESIKKQDKQLKEFYGDRFTYVTKEKNGKLSSITDIGYFKRQNPKRNDQFITGVRESDQGRGLAKWIKASMLFYIKDHFPTVEYISTGNADHNKPMLYINAKMGFERHQPGINYKIKMDKLLH